MPVVQTQLSYKKGVSKNYTKLTGKHMWLNLFIKKAFGCLQLNFVEKQLWHRCSLVNLAIFLRSPFLRNTYAWLLSIFVE